MRAAIYCRVSTDSQETEGTSLETQEASCRTYCQSHGLDVAAVYREARSGTLLKERLELVALLEAGRQRAFQRVIVHAVDRLTRGDVSLWGYLQVELGQHGVTIESATEQLDNSSIGQVIQTLHAWKAGTERASIVERSKRGRDYRLAAGQLATGGADLFGYRRDETRHKRVIYEPEAAIVRRIYELYSGGMSIRAVAMLLSSEGVARPKPGHASRRYAEWATSTINEMLHNPAYKGETIALRDDSNSRPYPPSRHIHLPPGVTPAIVTPELWDVVQARLATNHGDNKRNEARPYLLRGHIWCGVCGLRMSAAPLSGHIYYRCTHDATLRKACGNTLARQDAADAAAWGWARKQVTETGWLAERITQIRAGAGDADVQQRLAVARAALVAVEGELKRLLDLYLLDSGFDQGIMAEKSNQLQARKAAALSEIAALERSLNDREIRARGAERLRADITLLAERIAGATDWADQRRIIDALNTQAIWLKGELEFTARV